MDVPPGVMDDVFAGSSPSEMVDNAIESLKLLYGNTPSSRATMRHGFKAVNFKIENKIANDDCKGLVSLVFEEEMEAGAARAAAEIAQRIFCTCSFWTEVRTVSEAISAASEGLELEGVNVFVPAQPQEDRLAETGAGKERRKEEQDTSHPNDFDAEPADLDTLPISTAFSSADMPQRPNVRRRSTAQPGDRARKRKVAAMQESAQRSPNPADGHNQTHTISHNREGPPTSPLAHPQAFISSPAPAVLLGSRQTRSRPSVWTQEQEDFLLLAVLDDPSLLQGYANRTRLAQMINDVFGCNRTMESVRSHWRDVHSGWFDRDEVVARLRITEDEAARILSGGATGDATDLAEG